jgi:hypothetical protein
MTDEAIIRKCEDTTHPGGMLAGGRFLLQCSLTSCTRSRGPPVLRWGASTKASLWSLRARLGACMDSESIPLRSTDSDPLGIAGAESLLLSESPKLEPLWGGGPLLSTGA